MAVVTRAIILPPMGGPSRDYRSRSGEQDGGPYMFPDLRQRTADLSRPKEPKMIWITSIGPRVQWGTQDVLWPVSQGARSAEPTERVISLSRPKPNHQTGEKLGRPEFMYSCGRSSVIWDVSDGAKGAEATGRVLQLSEAKNLPDEYQEDRPHFVFSCGRVSPITQVTGGARSAPDRPYTEQLSRHKNTHPHFLGNRGVATIIPPPALQAKSSGRLESLSVPKNRMEGPFREPIWPVSDLAKKASTSGRIQELSKHKNPAEGYLPAREVLWSVSRGARRASTNTRLDELAQPIVRASMDHVQFDPNAFVVKDTAKKGHASKRVEELAQPIQR